MRFIEKNEVLFALSYKPLRSFDPFFVLLKLWPLASNNEMVCKSGHDARGGWLRQSMETTMLSVSSWQTLLRVGNRQTTNERLMRRKSYADVCVGFLKVKKAVLYILAKFYPIKLQGIIIRLLFIQFNYWREQINGERTEFKLSPTNLLPGCQFHGSRTTYIVVEVRPNLAKTDHLVLLLVYLVCCWIWWQWRCRVTVRNCVTTFIKI